MADIVPLHLKTEIDTSAAEGVAVGIAAAIRDSLDVALAGLSIDTRAIAGGAASAAVAEILRVRQATPTEVAVARVRAVHVRNPNSGTCEHCSERDYPDYAVPYPCLTIRAIEEQP